MNALDVMETLTVICGPLPYTADHDEAVADKAPPRLAPARGNRGVPSRTREPRRRFQQGIARRGLDAHAAILWPVRMRGSTQA